MPPTPGAWRGGGDYAYRSQWNEDWLKAKACRPAKPTETQSQAVVGGVNPLHEGSAAPNVGLRAGTDRPVGSRFETAADAQMQIKANAT